MGPSSVPPRQLTVPLSQCGPGSSPVGPRACLRNPRMCVGTGSHRVPAVQLDNRWWRCRRVLAGVAVQGLRWKGACVVVLCRGRGGRARAWWWRRGCVSVWWWASVVRPLPLPTACGGLRCRGLDFSCRLRRWRARANQALDRHVRKADVEKASPYLLACHRWDVPAVVSTAVSSTLR